MGYNYLSSEWYKKSYKVFNRSYSNQIDKKIKKDKKGVLNKFKKLPPHTKIYCAHEYTAANAQFSLSVEPNNSDLLNTVERVAQLRAKQQATVPTTLEQELATNPFLRADSPEIKATLGLQTASELAVFTELRKRKNRF